MIQQIGMLLVSFLITNWIYSEAMLLFPRLEPITNRVIQVARIPTHNEWGGIAQSQEAKKLHRQINAFLKIESPKKLAVKNNTAVKLANQKVPPAKDLGRFIKANFRIAPNKSVAGLFDRGGGELLYKSGDAIFERSNFLYLMLHNYIPFV
jgi:hypothetical protein